MKYIIAVALTLSVSLANAGPGELRGGSQYETKLRSTIPQIIGFCWGRA
jgi:hypothetical protein